MTITPNLNITLMEAAQGQKHITANEAFLRIDALAQLSVIDRNLSTPPGSPADGDTYIVGGSATGAWAGQEERLAVAFLGSWIFYIPNIGWKAYIIDESLDAFWNGSSWAAVVVSATPQVDSPNGASMLLGIAEEELTLSGPSVTSTVFIPTRSIIQGVSTYTSDTITGASSYDCGYAASGSEFGGGLGIPIGANNVGVIGPTAVYSDTTITLTANGSDFTGGKVRVALQYIQLTPPTS